ncbi:MAG: hypothetical protein KY476_04295 [Planctomycetes bacterium]|nr:hypothetical protein [Planctomycetota bacterium]
MDFFNALGDDQKALVGCAIALCSCGGIMSLSYYLGRGIRGGHTRDPHVTAALKFPRLASREADDRHARRAA